jgi:Kdo2-lipid IVA lauroyltransferase/acyltransferase
MKAQLTPTGVRLGRRVKSLSDRAAGRVAVGLLKISRRTDPDRFADRIGRLMARLGPHLREHRVGRANLAAAYPDKSPAEIEEILRGVWTNLGQVVAEYPHLDRMWDYNVASRSGTRIENWDEAIDRLLRLREAGKPVLVFAAHLGNWELPALAAAAVGVRAAVLYRAPNIGDVAAAVRDIRAQGMGELIPTGITAAARCAAAIERGTSVAMLVDQHFSRGVEVEFFGRRCLANSLIARLARQYECPIHGTRVIRTPGHRFRIDLTEPITPPRAADGRIDLKGCMQVITSVVERWVREYPEQWLWLHRRWR